MRRHGWGSRRRKGDDPASPPGSGAATRSGAAAPAAEEGPEADERDSRGVRGDAAPSSQPPALDIPELRKKENERKGVGAFWSAGSPGSGSALARAAAGGGYSAPLGLGRIAAALGQRIGVQTALGQLLLGRAGGWLVLSSIIGSGVLAGVFAGLLARRPPVQARAALPKLEGPRADIIVNAPKGKSLSFVQNANQGEINFDDQRPPAPKPEEAEAAASAPEETAPPEEAAGEPLTAEAVMEAAGAGASGGLREFGKLGDTRGGAGSGGGAFGGLGAAKGLERQLKTGLPPQDKNRGKLSRLARERMKMRASALSTARGRTNKAMGQLKLARFMSGQARNMPREEGGAQFAANAFEQSKTQGGEMPALMGPSGTPDVVVPPGSGAPDMTQTPPPVGPEVNATPYQPALDSAFNMGAAAGMMRMLGLLMMAVGAAMIAYGASLTPVGWGWIAAGVAMIGVGVMMLAQAQGMAKQAKALGDAIKAQDQTEQGQIATETAQAKADGREYTPPDLSDKTKRNEEVKEAVDEQQNATFEFEGEERK